MFEERLASEMNSGTSCVERREGKRRLRQQDRHRTGRAEVLQAGIEQHGVRVPVVDFQSPGRQ